MQRIASLVLAIAAFGATACGATDTDAAPPVATEPAAGTSVPIYFASAREAVVGANALLARSNWQELARCYDLSLTRVAEVELTSGRFFAPRAPAPGDPPPAIPHAWPFPKGSEFLDAEALGDPANLPCIWNVRTTFAIDQGGGMTQRVTNDVRMIQTKEGWRFLPPAAIDDGPRSSDAKPRPDMEWNARGADPVLFLRPSLRGRAEREIPRSGASSIPALVAAIERLKPLAAEHKGKARERSLPWEPETVYEPSDEEILLSLAGDRVWRTTQIAPMGTIDEVRRMHPDLPQAFEYPHIEVTRHEVAGSGLQYTAAPPAARRVALGKTTQ